jgi:hypothetical protein
MSSGRVVGWSNREVCRMDEKGRSEDGGVGMVCRMDVKTLYGEVIGSELEDGGVGED